MIGRAQPELTPSKRQKTGPGHYQNQCLLIIYGIHMRAISQEVLMNWICYMCLDITLSKLLSHLAGIIELTHLPLVPHIYASVNWVSIGSDNGLWSIRHQAIIWTNAGLLSIGTIFSEISVKIQIFHSQNAFENIVFETAPIWSMRRWVKSPKSNQSCCPLPLACIYLSLYVAQQQKKVPPWDLVGGIIYNIWLLSAMGFRRAAD